VRTLALLDREELREIVEENLSQEVRCHFCARAYQITSTEVRALDLHG